MRWFGLVGVALLCGCARENPAFDPEQGTTGAAGTPSSSSGIASATSSALTLESESADDSTASAADTEPEESTASGEFTDTTGEYGDDFACGEDQLNIFVNPPHEECTGDRGAEVVVRGQCVQIAAGEQGSVIALPADGCGTATCIPISDAATVLAAEYIPLVSLIGPSAEPICVRYDVYGFATGLGDCWWNALIVWSNEGALELAVGNGIPSQGDVNDIEQPNVDTVPFISEIDIPATCGDGSGCDRAGWRKLRFGQSDEWATANGIPAHSRLGDQDLLMFNWGLNIDLACERYGHWGIVPEGNEGIFGER